MDDRTLRVLEYDKVLRLLADHAASSLGKARAMRLQPETRAELIRQRLAETTQAVAAINDHGTPPLGGLTDISEALKRARVGAPLAGPELLAIAACIRCAGRMAEYFAEAQELAPDLWSIAERLSEQEELRNEIEHSLDDDGEVRRDASHKLSQLYSHQAVLESRGRERMETIMRAAVGRELLQDPIIVQRDGRFCLPVKTEKQAQLRGVVHDRSDSGATVFIEPLEIVQIGNELREVELEIEAEIKAILRDLSLRVQASSGDLQRDLGRLETLDFITARGRLSRNMDGVSPTVREDGVTVLRSARHPLLSGQPVPIDFWIGDDFDTLIITGPNTGGKTVTLKTVGLLTLMAQSGLHLPAEQGSEVSVFEQVWADIGDEQSLEQSLSTFSSHISQIIKIISRAEAWRRRQENATAEGQEPQPMSVLVLLDELGAGTDPTEGAVLGQAILEELHLTGCRTVATTHYNDLKIFAYASEGMENASVEFDVKTLQPTYRLLIGQPGSSNALEIAQRLGLPRRVTGRAREFLGGERLRVEDALREMRLSQQQLERERRRASRTQKDLEALQREYSRNLEELERRRAEAVEEGFEQALEIVRKADEEARNIIAELQRQPRQSKVTEEKRQQVAALRKRVEQEARRQLQPPAPPAPAEKQAPSAPAPAMDLEPGDRVRVKSLGREGAVAEELRDGVYLVEVGNMRVEAVVADLEPVAQPVSEEAQRLAAKMHLRKAYTFSPEIDLRGNTVDEAILELEKYLDDAQIARAAEVRILHGKGTGALRQGIQKFLRGQGAVKSFHLAPYNEGGEGVTIVVLK